MEKSYFKNFKKYLVPNVISMALMAVYTFTDSFVIGQKLGSTALGAMGICTPVITLTYAFGYLFGQGGAALYSIALGQKNIEKAKTIHSTAVISMLVFGIIAAAVLVGFTRPLALFLGADSVNIDYAVPYLRVVLLGIPLLMLELFSNLYVNNDGHPEVTMAATFFGVIMNVILDFVFVYAFKWGMFGAAFATVFCSFLGTLVKLIYIFRKSEGLKPSLSHFKPHLLGKILGNGFSSLILESSSAIVTFIFISQAIKYYGENGSVIYTVILNWSLIAVNFVIGAAEAAQPLISHSYGSGDKKGINVYLKYSLVVALVMGVIFEAVGYGMTTQLVTVFSNDNAELTKLIVSCFRIYLPAYIIMGISICIGSYFQAMEKPVRAFVIMLSRGILFPVILAFALPVFFGKTALWAATPIAELVSAVIAVVIIIAASPKNCISDLK